MMHVQEMRSHLAKVWLMPNHAEYLSIIDKNGIQIILLPM